jgi:hypothetical protein
MIVSRYVTGESNKEIRRRYAGQGWEYKARKDEENKGVRTRRYSNTTYNFCAGLRIVKTYVFEMVKEMSA